MKALNLLLAAGLVVTGASSAQAQSAVPAPGHYCLRTAIGGVTAEDEAQEALEQRALNFSADAPAGAAEVGQAPGPVLLGPMGVDVEITDEGGQTMVGFSNYMPDNGQIVRTDPVPAQPRAAGGLEFQFTDNWNTAGRGVVRSEGDGVVLTIARLGEADSFAGRYARRQFGEFKLNPGTCPPNR
jgi:hypothetical protein